jgi:hypothetical protein
MSDSPMARWRWAVVKSDLAALEKHMALTLAVHMNRDGAGAYASAETLARESGRSKRYVLDAVRALAEGGWIEWEIGRGTRASCYSVMFPPGSGATAEPHGDVSGATREPQGPPIDTSSGSLSPLAVPSEHVAVPQGNRTSSTSKTSSARAAAARAESPSDPDYNGNRNRIADLKARRPDIWQKAMATAMEKGARSPVGLAAFIAEDLLIEEQERDRAHSALEVLETCDRCTKSGWLLDDQGELVIPTVRCDHRETA